jgi:hypothetical protein
MRTLVGVAFDLYCKRCKRDAVATVQGDEGARVYAELDCCGREVEAFAVDVAEMLVDCGV